VRRLGILLSGRGSNFVAIADSIAAGRLDAEIAVVISNRVDAPGIIAARQRGLNLVLLPSRGIEREEYDARLAAALDKAGVDLICLAGYMRLLSASFIRRYPQRILNVHPSLLPAFPGLHAHRDALAHGVKVSGCTVHFVDEGLDSGPIIKQAAVAGARWRHGRISGRPHPEGRAPHLQRGHRIGAFRALPNRRTAGCRRIAPRLFLAGRGGS